MFKKPEEIRAIAESVYKFSAPELRKYISVLDFCAGYRHCQNDLRMNNVLEVVKESQDKKAIKHKPNCTTNTTGFHHDCTCDAFPLKSHKDKLIAELSDDNLRLKKRVEDLEAGNTLLVSQLKEILTFKGPEYMKFINGKYETIFSFVRKCLQEERIKSFHAGYTSNKIKEGE